MGTVGCGAVSLAPTHWMPGVPPIETTKNVSRHPKDRPDWDPPVHTIRLEAYVELVYLILNATEIPSSVVSVLCDLGGVTSVSEPQFPHL